MAPIRMGGAERSLAVFWHPDVLLHDTGAGVFEAAASALMTSYELHPESAPRILNMKGILERGPLAARVTWESVRLCAEEELRLVHESEYLDDLRRASDNGGRRFSATTMLGGGSWPALRAAASAAIEAARAAWVSPDRVTYALVRPPGHHAQRSCADGYCFLNNVALAAETVLRLGARRVAIIDFDVHHGNGTQECFWTRPDVLTVSLHMDHGPWGPTHPQTGSASEIGGGGGTGYNLNIPLPYGTGDSGYELAMRNLVSPLVARFEPDFVIGAIGQDANQFDPNGRQTLTMRGFHTLGEILRSLADGSAGGRLALIQEGGYARSYAAFCLHATLAGALGVPSEIDDPLAYMPDHGLGVIPAVEAAREAVANHWPGLSEPN